MLQLCCLGVEPRGFVASRTSRCPSYTKTPDLETARHEFPLFFDESLPQPLVAEIGPGDILFLPSLW
jgi:hypothetical protein